MAKDYDICLNNYDISNLFTINSDNSYVDAVTSNKYYYNNVTLNIHANFNRFTLEFLTQAIYHI